MQQRNECGDYFLSSASASSSLIRRHTQKAHVRLMCTLVECLVEFLPFFRANNTLHLLVPPLPGPAVWFPIGSAPVRLFCGHIKYSRESNTAIWLQKSSPRSQKMKKAPTLSHSVARHTGEHTHEWRCGWAGSSLAVLLFISSSPDGNLERFLVRGSWKRRKWMKLA